MSSTQDPSWLVESFPPARRSLRIALVTETYPPEINGVAMTLARLVNSLQARHHDIQLVRPRQTHSDAGPRPVGLEEVLTRGLPIPKYPHLRMGLPAKKSLVALWTRRRPDVVHIATEGPLGWSALQAARKLKLPISTDFRTNFHAYSRHYGVGWLHKPIAAYLRKFHNQADCTLVPTQGLLNRLGDSGFERLHVVARGVETRQFNPVHRSTELRASWGVADDDLVVLSVGRLAPEKNLGLLVQAFAAMQQVNPRVHLVVVGDGPSRHELQALCPAARCVGAKTGESLAAHYASADVFLFPSLTETYGNVTPEAMASGLAVLAFDYAAAAELVRHGDNGLVVPVTDEAAFIRRAADLAASPERVRSLKSRARETTLGRDWAHIAAQVESIWLGLLPPMTQPDALHAPRASRAPWPQPATTP